MSSLREGSYSDWSSLSNDESFPQGWECSPIHRRVRVIIHRDLRSHQKSGEHLWVLVFGCTGQLSPSPPSKRQRRKYWCSVPSVQFQSVTESIPKGIKDILEAGAGPASNLSPICRSPGPGFMSAALLTTAQFSRGECMAIHCLLHTLLTFRYRPLASMFLQSTIHPYRFFKTSESQCCFDIVPLWISIACPTERQTDPHGPVLYRKHK